MMMEVPVSRDLDGPFLLCSTKSCLWVEHSFPNGTVRTAVRSTPRHDLYSAVVHQITQKSETRQWGSVQPPTKAGVGDAFAYLADYDIIDVEVLFGEGFDTSLVPEDVDRTLVPWISAGWAVVVPVDRSFLGTLFEYDGGQYGMTIHNAPRGIAIIKPPEI